MSLPDESFENSVRRMMPVSTPPDQKKEVVALYRLLAQREQHENQYKLLGPGGETSSIPTLVVHILERLLELLARGDAVTVVPVGQELTTQQAANMLNVSRQYLVRLLDGGKIPYTKTGSHRRIRFKDVSAYKAHRDKRRLESLDALAQMSQDFGGYEELS